jgi:hypothetical protein
MKKGNLSIQWNDIYLRRLNICDESCNESRNESLFFGKNVHKNPYVLCLTLLGKDESYDSVNNIKDKVFHLYQELEGWNIKSKQQQWNKIVATADRTIGTSNK